MQGVATASLNTDFKQGRLTQACDKSILYPECDWEGECIEGASIVKKDNKLYMFYAGAYNNAPQQIGVAVSEDGLNWKRLSEEPFLRNGKPGEWNSSESGHPHLFTDLDGRTYCSIKVIMIMVRLGILHSKKFYGRMVNLLEINNVYGLPFVSLFNGKRIEG